MVWNGYIVMVSCVALVSSALIVPKVRIQREVFVIKERPITINEVTGTCYYAESNQCDGSPLVTADGSKIDAERPQRWVALSRDLLRRWGGPYDYGDSLWVFHSDVKINGWWVIHDCMNRRFKKRIDFLQKRGMTVIYKSRGVLISNKKFL